MTTLGKKKKARKKSRELSTLWWTAGLGVDGQGRLLAISQAMKMCHIITLCNSAIINFSFQTPGLCFEEGVRLQ